MFLKRNCSLGQLVIYPQQRIINLFLTNNLEGKYVLRPTTINNFISIIYRMYQNICVILDGNSEHTAHEWRKIDLFGKKSDLWLLSNLSNAVNRLNNRDCYLRARLISELPSKGFFPIILTQFLALWKRFWSTFRVAVEVIKSLKVNELSVYTRTRYSD